MSPTGERRVSDGRRAAVVEALTRPCFDLLVIGGGINGAGIARDAAGRGLSVALAGLRKGNRPCRGRARIEHEDKVTRGRCCHAAFPKPALPTS